HQKAKSAFRKGHGIGQVGRPSDAGKGKDARSTAELSNAIQRFFIENSRLGIPVVFHEECLHGHAAIDSTSFSQPVGLGATFDPDLVERLFTMTALEARVRGTHQALTPVVDVAREPRWGRVEETYGEDPYLVSRMAIAAVRGFQGDASFRDKTRVMATLKHFAAHGQPESGTNCGPVNVSERVLRETFLYTFKEAIQKAGAISVMASYNEIDGVPSHANRWLLRDVLRKEWGFKGFVVSDYYAIAELHFRPEVRGHAVAKDRVEACELAVRAGVNIELPEPDCYTHLVSLVKKGVLKESQLDELVLPMLEWKFRFGLFEDPYVDPDEAERVVGCEAHRDLALEAARETITLLKNENGAAPVDANRVKTIAVIGPNAHRPLWGGYSSVPKHNVTVLEGIRAKVGDRLKVLHSVGCEITKPGSWYEDPVEPSDPQEDRRQIAEAVKVARKADVIVLALGGNELTSREAWSFVHLGDRPSLNLIGRQTELVEALAATGKPIIAFVFNGRPLAIEPLNRHAAAIFECWYLGQETGRAVADVLFGDYNPGGKLPITIPRSAGHLPAFYNYKPTARRGYLFDDISPIYAFGFGLSYTTFRIENVRLAKTRIRPDGSTRVTADLTNTGSRAGSEVVQMYIRDRVSSVTRPIKELKGFRRVFLEAGASAAVEFEITPELLAFYNVDMQFVVEPGEFEIMVGNSSRDADLQTVVLTVK
ncbi:MAG TPA: glycoside hydrolase family 3 N-terminal domain-containing protein, partial [Verrucomicrobiae bacterium]|nr:glycoside hydrolase family 3 N-terminal domain-containing protein [Verrucomicrobiae bacterium]